MSCEHGNPVDACALCDALDDAFKRGYESGKEPITGADHVSDNCVECMQKSINSLEQENAELKRIIVERKPELWCVWDKRNKQVFWSHPRLHGGEEACKDYVAAATIPEWLEVRPLVVFPERKEKRDGQ